MASKTVQFKIGSAIGSGSAGPPESTVVSRWTYPAQPYLVNAPVTPTSEAVSTDTVGVASTPGYWAASDGTLTITYDDALTDARVVVNQNLATPGSPSAFPSSAYSGGIASQKILGSFLTSATVAGMNIRMTSGASVEMQMRNGATVSAIQKTVLNTSSGGTGDVTFTIDAALDVLSEDAQKPLYFRTLNIDPPQLSGAEPHLPLNAQIPSSWVQFTLPPFAFATATCVDDTYAIDASKSYDLDDGIASIQYKIGSVVIDSILQTTGFRKVEFSVDAARALTGLAIAPGSTLAVQVIVTDRAGHVASATPSALIPTETIYQIGAVQSPSGRLTFATIESASLKIRGGDFKPSGGLKLDVLNTLANVTTPALSIARDDSLLRSYRTSSGAVVMEGSRDGGTTWQ